MNLRWMLPQSIGRRYAPAVAFTGAFQIGYWSLKLGTLIPEGHWQWLPHCLAVAAIVGAISASSDLTLLDRFLLYAIAAAGMSFLLIPTWEELAPPRPQYIMIWSGTVVALTLLLHPLVKNLPGVILPWTFFATSMTAAVILTHSGSLLFGQIGIAAMGGLLGITLVSAIDRNCRSLDGIEFPIAVYLCSVMMIGHVNSFSNIPVSAYAIVPFAPLGLTLSLFGPLATLKGRSLVIAQLLLPLIICATALGIAFWFEPLSSGGEEALY